MFLYNAFSSLSAWIVFYHYLRGGNKVIITKVESEDNRILKSFPNQDETLVKVVVSNTQASLDHLELMDKHTINENAIISSRSREAGAKKENHWFGGARIANLIMSGLKEIVIRPPVLASALGLIVGLIEPIQNLVRYLCDLFFDLSLM